MDEESVKLVQGAPRDIAEFAELWRGEVRRQTRALQQAAAAAEDEVREAKRAKRPMPYVSLATGRDLSYVIEASRRWSHLIKELDEQDAGTIAELGEKRVAYWHEALTGFVAADIQLSTGHRPTPIVQRAPMPRPRSFKPRPPSRP